MSGGRWPLASQQRSVDGHAEQAEPGQLTSLRLLQFMAFGATAMMAMSGSLKQALPTSYIPLDFTIATTLLSLALGAAYVLATGSWPSGRPLAVLTLFLVMALAGTYRYVPSLAAEEKTDRFFAVTLLAVLAATLAVRHHRDAYELIRIIAIVSLGLSVWIALTGQRQYGAGGRLTTELGSTIAFGRAAGFVLVAVTAWLLTTQQLNAAKIALALGILALEIWTMLAIASRGPVQAYLFATLAMIAPQLRNVKLRSIMKALVMLAVLIGALVAVWDMVPERSKLRIVEVSGSSTNARQFAWGITWRRLDASPFGNGWGSWARQDDVEGLTYPHSFILEVWFEAGVVGLVALLAILWITLRHQERIYRVDPTAATLITGSIVFWAASAMVSGDMNDNKVLWIVLALSAATVFTANEDKPPEASSRSEVVARPSRPGTARRGKADLTGSVSRARFAPLRSPGRSGRRPDTGASAG